MIFHAPHTRPCIVVSMVFFFFVSLGVSRAELPDYPMTLGDMEVLAGYYTPDGKYLGGLPKPHGLSREIYQCTDYQYSEANNTASNATSCMSWSADESYGGGFQLGTCDCKSLSNNNEFCFDWICDQGSTEFAFCQCDDDIDSSDSNLFCSSWSCKQISSGGRAEYESYNCQRPSPSGHYCEAWNGNVSATDEFEVVSCECMANWDGDQVCSFWECEELGLSTCSSAGSSWCDLGVSVGVGGGMGLLGVALICLSLCGMVTVRPTKPPITPTNRSVGRTNTSVRGPNNDPIEFSKGMTALCALLGVLWCLSWAVGVVIWGGQDGATYVAIMWGLPILITAAALGCAVHLRRNKDEQNISG